jgi:energy-coupling factor transport system permease protein
VELAPFAPSAYHRLNPLTKAVLAAVAVIAVLVLGGYVAFFAIFALLVVPGAAVGHVLRPVVRGAGVAALPIGIAVALVSTFGLPGETTLFRLGPFDATLEGLDAGARVIVRLFVMAAALTLFGLTTPPRALVADLDRRGVSPRLTFAADATLGALPALAEQARTVRDAQRSRGLDIDGNLAMRLRGVPPLAGPVIAGTLHAVEARALALEARAFGRPGRRELLWVPADRDSERLLRWIIAAAALGLIAASVTGALPRLP